MDIITIFIGIFLFLMGFVFTNRDIKIFLRALGAIVILVGGIWFAVSFMQGYNNAVKNKYEMSK
jgi:flagellar motor component MotA